MKGIKKLMRQSLMLNIPRITEDGGERVIGRDGERERVWERQRKRKRKRMEGAEVSSPQLSG